jgi:hypothetical protein
MKRGSRFHRRTLQISHHFGFIPPRILNCPNESNMSALAGLEGKIPLESSNTGRSALLSV